MKVKYMALNQMFDDTVIVFHQYNWKLQILDLVLYSIVTLHV